MRGIEAGNRAKLLWRTENDRPDNKMNRSHHIPKIVMSQDCSIIYIGVSVVCDFFLYTAKCHTITNAYSLNSIEKLSAWLKSDSNTLPPSC